MSAQVPSRHSVGICRCRWAMIDESRRSVGGDRLMSAHPLPTRDRKAVICTTSCLLRPTPPSQPLPLDSTGRSSTHKSVVYATISSLPTRCQFRGSISACRWSHRSRRRRLPPLHHPSCWALGFRHLPDLHPEAPYPSPGYASLSSRIDRLAIRRIISISPPRFLIITLLAHLAPLRPFQFTPEPRTPRPGLTVDRN